VFLISSVTSPKQFDVFAKKPKTGWAYYCSIEACTPDEAKIKVIAGNIDLQKYKLAVYPKR
jgi:hypothetical protein